MAMLRTVNRWAIQNYLETIAKQENIPSFAIAAEALKKNERPKINFAEDTFVKAVEDAVDEYMLLQDLAFRLDGHLLGLKVSEDRRGAIIGAVMYDGTKRYPEWERQHAKPATGKILVVNGATGEAKTY